MRTRQRIGGTPDARQMFFWWAGESAWRRIMTRTARIGLAAVLLLGGATIAMAQNGPATGGYPPARWRQRQRPSDTQHCGFRLTLSLRTLLRVRHRGDLIVGDGHRSRPCGPRLRWRYRASSDPGPLARAGLRLICRPAYSGNGKGFASFKPVTKKEPRPAVCDR